MSRSTTTPEAYMIGYADYAEAFMTQRTAATHASFLLPHLKSGMSMLDCGCGPGTISMGIAKVIAPGKFVGIDRESSQLERARERFQNAGLQTAVFEQANIYQLPFPSDTFDVVFAHALLEHLSEPLNAILEMVRILKPGGMLAVRSPDWGGFLSYPPDKDVAAGMALFQERQRANGGNVCVGRELKSLFLRAGLEQVKPSGVLEFCEPVSYMTHFIAGRIEDGSGFTEEGSRIVKALRTFHENPEAAFAISWCEAIGKKKSVLG